MTVVHLGTSPETVLEFVARNGATLPHQVAERFGRRIGGHGANWRT